MIKRNDIIKIAKLIVLQLTLCGSLMAAEQPNIVIIMADDLGYGDVTCYGATKIKTPNIDRLANEGMKFSDAHSAASVSSPSRDELMTGRSPWRLHKKGNGYRLDSGRMTIASLVKGQGYKSAAIGKWHLGDGRDWEQPLSPGPLEAGFDYHFGVPTNHNDKYRAFVENPDFGYDKWKLITSKDSNLPSVHQLFDLSKDPGETKDVAGENPNIVEQLAVALTKPRFDGRTDDRTQPAFVHPGISHRQASIDLIKSKLAVGALPWKDAWEQLRESNFASLDWTPSPRPHVERGAYNHPDIGGSDFLRDGSSAYTHAIQWVLSGNEAHAKKSAEIIDAWSRTLKTVTNHDAKLLIGMGGLKYCNAAELLKHTWEGWPAENQRQFETMLRDVWYPVIEDFYPSANGNWDASMLQTMIAMGVHLDDRAMFDRAVDYFRQGKGNGAIGNYFNEFGECQESGRDQAHTQMGLEFLANTCETAWNQNVDLYGELDNRLLKGFEYTAKYNLGFEVAYEPFISFEGRYHYKTISDKSRGKLRSMYEPVFNHYHNRKELEAPHTEQAVSKTRLRSSGRSRQVSSTSLPWGTLMFAK